MAQRKILLDSNAYLRLAQTIHLLLHVEFGDDCHCPRTTTGTSGGSSASARRDGSRP